MTLFQEALRTGNLEALRSIPKSDLHNHAFGGGNRAWIARTTGHDIAPLDLPLSSMAEMHDWVGGHVGRLFDGPRGRLTAFEATLVQARYDGMLSRVKSLAAHPIRRLFDAGVVVTINTDDVLVFGQGVSEEFRNLFRAGLFDAEELESIRLAGLVDPVRPPCHSPET
jgi:hypothetical protein